MTKLFLSQQINNLVNAKRENRLKVAQLVLENPETFYYLVELAFDTKNKDSIKAAWVFEFVCAQKLELLYPYLDYFTENLSSVSFDGAVRPISKICNFLAINYSKSKPSIIKKYLNNTHINSIIETSFDWLIGNQKVAVKAYTMNTLFLFGKNYNWVHQELKLILEQNIAKESAAYKARGKITLDLLNKK
jgi:hypothetical protein